MILIRIHGGLGNQMFQYALGLRLSLMHNTVLKLDYSYLKTANQSGRDFRLFGFSITAKEASPEEIRSYTGAWQKLLDRTKRSTQKKRVIEKDFTFDPHILDRDDGYFDGHWQSEKYFNQISAVVRKEFSLKKPFGQKAARVAASIREYKNPVSVHIRRGDYVTIPKVAGVHGTLPLSYYEKACAHILQNVPDAHFFISSDDIAWAREHFPQKENVTFVSSPDITDFEEMTLMSLCAHNIIANSTFSWWGAWLNGNPTKTVIAPRQWFLDTSKDTRDLIPPSWIKI